MLILPLILKHWNLYQFQEVFILIAFDLEINLFTQTDFTRVSYIAVLFLLLDGHCHVC